MRIYEPAYYGRFRCIAARCPDSCCKEWEVYVDPEARARYDVLPGMLGAQLRRGMRTEADGSTYMTLENGRCPMWRADGLCRIQAELGEAALCGVCRQFPRLRHDYGDFAELGLELSCPEAAQWILADDGAPMVCREVPGGTEPEYDSECMALLLRAREAVLALADRQEYSIGEILAVLLLYSYDVDGALTFPEDFPETLSPEKYLKIGRELPKSGDIEEIFDFFKSLEILTSQWQAVLEGGPRDGQWQEEYRGLIRYFVRRYYLQAVSDGDLAGRAKFIVLSCLMIRSAGGALLEAAQLYSKEIENDGDNVNAILDGAFTIPALRDTAVLDLLLR